MSLLPDSDRVLLGPGPSLTSPRVMRAMAAPTVSHLDPVMLRLLDDVREEAALLIETDPELSRHEPLRAAIARRLAVTSIS